MLIRQEESTPIGDYFHDSGLRRVFTKIEESVDEFEVETTELCVYIDSLISGMKGLKSKIKSVEGDAVKQQAQEKVAGMIQKGGIE